MVGLVGWYELLYSYLADVTSRAEAVWIISQWITVTAKGKALALDTFRGGRTRGVRIISCRVTITPRGEGGLAGAVLESMLHNNIMVMNYNIFENRDQWRSSSTAPSSHAVIVS